MKSSTASAMLCLLFGFVFAPLGAAEAQQQDAVATTNMADTARVDAGTVQVLVTAIIRENIQVEFTAPLTLTAMKKPNQAAAPNVVLVRTAERSDVRKTRNTELSTSILIRGTPNQAFAVTVPETARLVSARNGSEMAIITHDAGESPYIGPQGSMNFVVAANFDLAQNMAINIYTGTLDVIVSHN